MLRLAESQSSYNTVIYRILRFGKGDQSIKKYSRLPKQRKFQGLDNTSHCHLGGPQYKDLFINSVHSSPFHLSCSRIKEDMIESTSYVGGC